MDMQRLVRTLATLALTVLPALAGGPTNAVRPHDTTTYNGVTFPRNSTGNGCLGPVIGVYGSSALQSVILRAAHDYCLHQKEGYLAANQAYDVEYVAGGDSCPGDTFAATDSTDPVVGVSDVFAPSCGLDG